MPGWAHPSRVLARRDAMGSRLRAGAGARPPRAFALQGLTRARLTDTHKKDHRTHPGMWGTVMRTNIVIDDGLMRRAMRATGLRTKRAVVQAGLRLLIQTHGQASIRRLRGKIAWNGDLETMRASRVAEP